MTRKSGREWLNRLSPLLVLLAVYLLFVLMAPASFSSMRNLELIVRQTTIVGITALGMTMVIIGAGIDLAVGSMVALVTVVIAWLLAHGAAPLAAAGGGLLAGLICGLLNGVLITRLKLVPFIVTLGTLLIFRGLAKGLSHEQKIDAPLTWLNELSAALKPDHAWMLVPPGVWIFAVLAVLVALALRYTRF